MLANTNFEKIFFDEPISPKNDAWAQQPLNHWGFQQSPSLTVIKVLAESARIEPHHPGGSAH